MLRTMFRSSSYNLPYCFHRDGVSPLKNFGGISLGLVERSPTNRRRFLRRGEALLLYTDGVTEAMDARRALYSGERLEGFGYSDSRAHEIRVRLGIEPPQMTIEVEDDGKPFNPLEAKEVDTTNSLEDRAAGGLASISCASSWTAWSIRDAKIKIYL